MKILFGKEIMGDNINGKDHKLFLEDDREYKESGIEPQIFCSISNDDIAKITKFIKHVQILGVDNEAVKLMYEFEESLKNKIEERKVENIINDT